MNNVPKKYFAMTSPALSLEKELMVGSVNFLGYDSSSSIQIFFTSFCSL